ncbi:hypothetical protein [Candidatus Electrothrix sp.]|uniref:hypothetical protein n=1 Tax=Candidatus Electrothrix sp. TaxID=2170559 RepID=UPI0040570EF0
MSATATTLNDINIKAIALLSSKLGTADTIRFLNQFTTGFGDYTEERKKVFDKMSMDEIVTEIKARRKRG